MKRTTSSSSVRRPVGALVALLLLAAGLTSTQLVTAPAQAAADPGTITFIKGYNVWITLGDGSRPRQLTSGGTAAVPWTSPTQSDAGIVVAGRGNLIYRMDQFGTVLNTIDPPDLRTSAGELIGGRTSALAISPDGSKIAYTYEFYSCPVGAACRVRWVTAFTAATGLTSPSTWGVTYYDNPSWVTNSRVLVNSWLVQQIRLFDLGRGDIFWFDENSYTSDDRDLEDAELSRDGTFAAAVRDIGDNSRIIWYSVTGNVRDGARPPIPTPLCQTNAAAGFSSPTFSPDSRALAWAEPDGIWVQHDLLACEDGPLPTRVIPGGSSPAWSKATMRTTRPVYDLGLRSAPRISGVAKAGRVLTASKGVWSPAPTAYSYRWYRNGVAIPNATKASYKVTAKDRKRKLTVRVTGTRPGFKARTVSTAPVKVR